MKKLIFFFALLLSNNLSAATHVKSKKLQAYKNNIALLNACLENRVEKARELLLSGVNANSSKEGVNGLHLASEHNHLEIVKLLINNKADINFIDPLGWTALHRACLNNNTEIAKYLLSHKANFNIVTDSGLTPLHLACFSGNLDIVKLLVQKGANINIKHNIAPTPIMAACEQGKLEIVRFLLPLINDNSSKDISWLLYTAIKSRQHNLALYLINCNIDTETTFGPEEWTLLHTACSYGDLDIVKELINKKANINALTKKKSTPIFVAFLNNYLNIVNYFIKELNYDIDKENAAGMTILHEACRVGDLETIKQIISFGANIKCINENGDTILHIACYQDKFDAIKYIIEDLNFDVNTQNSNHGGIPLHIACYNSLRTTKYLISKGANIRDTNRFTLTCLDAACRSENHDVINYLLEIDKEFFTEKKRLTLLLHTLCFSGKVSALKYLEPILQLKFSEWEGILHTACKNSKNIETVKYLLSKNIDINGLSDGETALHTTCKYGYLELATFLIQKGAKLKKAKIDINMKARNGFTPLHTACYHGHSEIVKLLINNGANILEEITPETDSSIKLYLVSDKENIEETSYSFNKDQEFNEDEILIPFDLAFTQKQYHILPILMEYIYLKDKDLSKII